MVSGKGSQNGFPKKREKQMIDEIEIMEAIENDENAGFCKACGNKQYGCEPDARNYECEECGKNEVYGAEEMILEIM